MNLYLFLDVWGVLADALFLVFLAWISITDMRKRLIPNQAVLIMFILGLLKTGLAICIGQSWWHYPAGMLIALPFFLAWLRSWMGAGDVKLIMACGLFLGLPASIAMVGLMLIILVGIAAYLAARRKSMKTRIPLGPVFAAATAGAIIPSLISIW